MVYVSRGNPRSRLRRYARSALLSAGAAAVVAGIGAAPAQSATLLNCSGTTKATVTPGLTTTPQAVTFREDDHYGTCLTPQRLTHNADGVAEGRLPSLSCLTVVRPAPAFDYRVTYNTGVTSHMDFTGAQNDAAEAFTYTAAGRVTYGLFAGARAVLQVTHAPTALNCLAGGSASDTLRGVINLTLTDAVAPAKRKGAARKGSTRKARAHR